MEPDMAAEAPTCMTCCAVLCCAMQDVSVVYKDNKFDLAVDSMGSRSECWACCAS